jgi:hypothetical protein
MAVCVCWSLYGIKTLVAPQRTGSRARPLGSQWSQVSMRRRRAPAVAWLAGTTIQVADSDGDPDTLSRCGNAQNLRLIYSKSWRALLLHDQTLACATYQSGAASTCELPVTKHRPQARHARLSPPLAEVLEPNGKPGSGVGAIIQYPANAGNWRKGPAIGPPPTAELRRTSAGRFHFRRRLPALAGTTKTLTGRLATCLITPCTTLITEPSVAADGVAGCS